MRGLRILHVSDTPLPDIRIEKMAYTSRKKGCKTFFAGPGFDVYALNENVFDGAFHVSWNRLARLGVRPHYNWVKRGLKRVINVVKPDLIHAHNVFTAKIVSELGYPFVFDDHELYSAEKMSDIEWAESGLIDKVAGRYEVWKWSRWEHEVANEAPVITVSDKISEVYRWHGGKAYVVPNYPSLFELSKAYIKGKKNDVFTMAYVGNDISQIHRPYRDTRGIIEMVRRIAVRFAVIGDRKLRSHGTIISKGFVPHLKLYEILSEYHVGIIPWKKHLLHKYFNPNKPYLYAHSGMVVVVPSSLTNVITAFEGNCRTIEKFSDLEVLLRGLSNDIEATIEEGQKTKEYASQNLIWELHEERILKAYEDAT